jgi:hypothetical protein
MAALSSVSGFRSEGSTLRFAVQVRPRRGGVCARLCLPPAQGVVVCSAASLAQPASSLALATPPSPSISSPEWNRQNHPHPIPSPPRPGQERGRWPHRVAARCGRLPLRLQGRHPAARPPRRHPRLLLRPRLRRPQRLRPGLPPQVPKPRAWGLGLGRRRPRAERHPHARQPQPRRGARGPAAVAGGGGADTQGGEEGALLERGGGGDGGLPGVLGGRRWAGGRSHLFQLRFLWLAAAPSLIRAGGQNACGADFNSHP